MRLFIFFSFALSVSSWGADLGLNNTFGTGVCNYDATCRQVGKKLLTYANIWLINYIKPPAFVLILI